MTSEPLRVRFAPSPTGALHIGGARTALYNWLHARGQGGTMVLRIEDTDLERSTPEHVEQIIEALSWLELDWDEGPLSQFQRRASHGARIEELIGSGRAYRDPATSEQVREWKGRRGGTGYRGEPRDEPGAAVRLRVPDEGATVVHDLIRGEVSFENRLTDDLVIARGDGTPLYNFAVAVDDAEMGITDVIRGDDHLSNTPKQLLVLGALGFVPPRYAHLPLLHGPDGKKLSKRHGAASVQELRDAGYLPAAVRNYLALLGWGTDDDTTLLSTDELVARFDLARVGRASAVFDFKKLRWMNGRFMRELDLPEYERRLAEHLARTDPAAASAFEAAPAEARHAACEIVREKAQTMAEVWQLVAFLFGAASSDEAAWEKVMGGEALRLLSAARRALAGISEFDAEAVEAALTGIVEAEAVKPKALYQPIRVALTGTTVSPGIFESVAALGREQSLARLDAAILRLGDGATDRSG
ncbi:MAG: glutamate--tRNA ligase [Solirubrobacterales bacterium]